MTDYVQGYDLKSSYIHLFSYFAINLYKVTLLPCTECQSKLDDETCFYKTQPDETYLDERIYSQPSKENMETKFIGFHETLSDGTQPDDMKYSKPGKENIETRFDSPCRNPCNGTRPDDMKNSQH